MSMAETIARGLSQIEGKLQRIESAVQVDETGRMHITPAEMEKLAYDASQIRRDLWSMSANLILLQKGLDTARASLAEMRHELRELTGRDKIKPGSRSVERNAPDLPFRGVSAHPRSVSGSIRCSLLVAEVASVMRKMKWTWTH